MIDQTIRGLLDDPAEKSVVGIVFVTNVMDHIEVGHLVPDVFGEAWRTLVEDLTAGRTSYVDPDSARSIIIKLVGDTQSKFKGLQSPPALTSWMEEKLVTIALQRRWEKRLRALHRLRPAVLPKSQKVPPKDPFPLWCTLASHVPASLNADDARDLLGLVHRQNGDELVRVEFETGTLAWLNRPTALDGGANERFQAVCKAEWAARIAGLTTSHLSRVIRLDAVREERQDIEGSEEVIAQADSQTVDCGVADPIGKVQAGGKDRAFDGAYKDRLTAGRARTRGDLEAFLRVAHMPEAHAP